MTAGTGNTFLGSPEKEVFIGRVLLGEDAFCVAVHPEGMLMGGFDSQTQRIAVEISANTD